jgi:hypothetical protein
MAPDLSRARTSCGENRLHAQGQAGRYPAAVSTILPLFPPAIQDFANAFVTMQEKRHDADYDPYVKFTKSAVAADIALVRQAITDFIAEPTKDRRAFAAHVLFKSRD